LQQGAKGAQDMFYDAEKKKLMTSQASIPDDE
jgi:hypothetical protein